MTKRDEKYLRIIYSLSRKLYFTIADCNATIAAIEQRANEEVDRLRLAQVQADQIKIDTALESADMLWTELQQVKKKKARKWRVEE